MFTTRNPTATWDVCGPECFRSHRISCAPQKLNKASLSVASGAPATHENQFSLLRRRLTVSRSPYTSAASRLFVLARSIRDYRISFFHINRWFAQNSRTKHICRSTVCYQPGIIAYHRYSSQPMPRSRFCFWAKRYSFLSVNDIFRSTLSRWLLKVANRAHSTRSNETVVAESIRDKCSAPAECFGRIRLLDCIRRRRLNGEEFEFVFEINSVRFKKNTPFEN